MIRALLLASFALALPADALAAKRPCLTLEQVEAKHPGRHAKYRSVHGHRCWFVGRTPKKSEFDVGRKAKKSRGDAESRSVAKHMRSDIGGYAEALPRPQQGQAGPRLAYGSEAGVAPSPRDAHSDGVDPYLCPRGCLKLRGMVIRLQAPDWSRMSAEARLVFVRDATEARRRDGHHPRQQWR